MPQTKFRSLHRKLLISVSSIAIILAIVSSILAFIFEFDRASSHTEMMLIQLLETVEDTASIAAYSNNEQIAQDVINGLLKNDIIQNVDLLSEGGFHLSQTKNNQPNTEPAISHLLYSPFDNTKLIGKIKVQPASQFNLTEAKHSAISSAITSILLIAVTTIFIFYIIRSNFSKPLAFVSNTLHAINIGKKQRIPPLKKNSNDELGLLVKDINALLDSLELKFNQEHSLRQSLQSLEQQLRHIFNSTSAGLFLLDQERKLLTCNVTLERILKQAEIDSESLKKNTSFSSIFNEQFEFDQLVSSALDTGQLKTLDISLKFHQNTTFWLHCLLSKTIDPSGNTCIEGVVFDISDRIEREKLIKHEADHDPLTGLLRSNAAQEQFKKLLLRIENPIAYCMLVDLDGFKLVNDTYGHSVGDKVLNISAKRLSNSVRTTDIISRIGGDEFLIILIGYAKNSLILQTAENIISVIQKPMHINNELTVQVGISLGISEFIQNIEDGDTYNSMLIEADKAMYEVKHKGKNGYCYKDQENQMIVKLIRKNQAIKTNK